MAGIKVVSAIDINEDCIKTLKTNELFNDTEAVCGDLHNYESSYFKNILDKHQYNSFILIGGAPCQPFSKMGYWVGNKTRKGINDPRALLVNEYLRILQDLKPDGFVFENVESLLHPTNKVIVDEFISIISEQGYTYKLIKANALNYGVPQKEKDYSL